MVDIRYFILYAIDFSRPTL